MDTNQQPSIALDPFVVNLIDLKAGQLCRRNDYSQSDYDDIRQNLRLYLLEKAHLFNPVRGRLEAFATNAINTWVKMELRARQRERRRESFKAVSLERTPVECDGDVTTLGAVLLEADGRRLPQTDSPDAHAQFEQREAIDHAMSNLSPEDRAILTHVAEHGVASAARAFNRSRRQILKVRTRARAHFEKAGLGSD